MRRDEPTYVWKAVLIVWLAILLIVNSDLAGAKEIRIGLIEHNVTATNVCAAIEHGDVIILNTGGGSVSEGHALAECIRSKNVLVKVRKALSAGVYLVFGAKRVCFDIGARVGAHSPYTSYSDGSIKYLTTTRIRNLLGSWGNTLYSYGYTQESIFYLLGVTIMTPPESISYIPLRTVKAILGDRYVGECGDVS